MRYSCKDVCNMDRPCGNRHCSANPKFVGPTIGKDVRHKPKNVAKKNTFVK